MKTLEFIRTELELTVYENKYKIRFPEMGELSFFEDKNKEEEVDHIANTAEFLDMLGLPKDVVLKMEALHVQAVIEALTEKKQ